MKDIVASNHFIKFKKHSHNHLQLEIDKQVKEIFNNPNIGELKKGDLNGVRVHKFKYHGQLYLLSYEIKNSILYLYMIGSHENYYKKLKIYLSS